MPSARALLAMPEANLAMFGFLLNFPWEFLQVPLYAAMPQVPHWEAIRVCARATLGDVAILLLAHGLVGVAARDRRWVLQPRAWQVASLVVVGAAITIVIERLALQGRWFGGWGYDAAMPVVPLLGVGLAPLLQWVLLPPLAVWFVRRQLAGRR